MKEFENGNGGSVESANPRTIPNATLCRSLSDFAHEQDSVVGFTGVLCLFKQAPLTGWVLEADAPVCENWNMPGAKKQLDLSVHLGHTKTSQSATHFGSSLREATPFWPRWDWVA